MSEQNKPDDKSSPAVPTIAIVALLVSLFAAQETILKPTRPAMIDTERASTEDVRSRLWQDPFQAVEQHRKQFSSENEGNKSSLSVSGTVSQNEEESSFTISGTISQRMEKSASDECNKPIINSIEELRCRIKKEVGALHVLAVMVPGGPYAEDHEWRMRSRYALISGLYTGNYAPQDAEHIKFINFKDACKKTLEDENKKKNYFCDFPEYVPYEYFEPIKQLESTSNTSNQNKILVLWLNNDTFARSPNILKTLYQLKEQIQPSIKLNIIGPSNSDTLKQLYEVAINQKQNPSNKYLKNNLILSPFGTADFDWLTNANSNNQGSKLDESGLKEIIHTIGKDSGLANTLLCELSLRGITPYQITSKSIKKIEEECLNLKGLKLTEDNRPHHIVLIGQLDTFYSRMLTESILKRINTFNGFSSDTNITETHVHRFNYLQGLDGITSKSTPVNQDNKNKESQTNKPDSKETKEQAERPTGTSQLDYLLRLAEQIKQLDKIKAKEGGIKAIGITGNDTYDKLLILQALRKKFPNVLFFTTDLDARLFHPTEIKSTRNLIVASSYGLQLNQELQKNTPPFRDSYQTALYLTTLLALQRLHPEKQSLENSLEEIIKKSLEKPRLFEIGNYGAIDLSHAAENTIHPEPENATTNQITYNKIAFIIAALSVLMLFLLYQLPQALRPIINIIFPIAICLAIIYYHLQPLDDYGSEPVSFTNGTSIWPANGIRIIAFLLSIYFLYSIRNQLNKAKEKYPSSADATSLPWFLIDQWHLKTSNKNESINFTNQWSNYLELRKFRYCAVRIAFILVLFIIFVILLIQAGLSIPEAPFRGGTSYNTTFGILIIAVLAYLTLTLVIADITRLTSHFIKELASCSIDWPPETTNSHKKYGLLTNAVKNKILMDFIHQQANAINNFIYYPFFILFLMILSRSYFFDNWQISPLLLFIFIFTALITLVSAIRLRKASQDARDFILTTLENIYTSSLANDVWHRKEKNSDIIKLLIKEIKDLKDGVFQPLSHHPIALSLLIPFSSIAGVSLFEYFAFSAS